MIDSSIVRAHQQAATGKGGKGQAPGRLRGRLRTKIHRLADALGRPPLFRITPGQTGGIASAPELLESQQGGAVIAGKACDSNALRDRIIAMGAQTALPSRSNRKVHIPHDAQLYEYRNRVERFRRFATRYDRRTIDIADFGHLAAATVWLR